MDMFKLNSVDVDVDVAKAEVFWRLWTSGQFVVPNNHVMQL